MRDRKTFTFLHINIHRATFSINLSLVSVHLLNVSRFNVLLCSQAILFIMLNGRRVCYCPRVNRKTLGN